MDSRIHGKELLMLLIAAVILGAGAYFLGPSITSFVIKEFSYSDEINLVVTSSGNYTWQPANIGDLKSLKIDGRMTTYGKARAYIESDGIRYLIFDSTRLNESTIESSNNSITGFAVKEEKDKNKKPEWIGAGEFDVNGTTLINLSEQFSDKDGDSLVYSVSEADGLKTSIDSEMITIKPESNDIFNTTITFIASDGIDSKSHTVDLRVNANIKPVVNQTPENQSINITPIINLTTNESILNQTQANETINVTINETINLTLPANETINATITNETNLTAANITKTIAINLSYNSGTVYDANDDGEESVNGIVDLTVQNTKFNWNADESKLCTRWEVYNAEKSSLTTFCNGNSNCCAFVSLLPTKSNWSETYYSAFGKDNAGYDNIVSAQVLYYDVNLSIPNSEIYYSGWGNKSVKFFDEEKEFSDACVETCALSGLNKSSYSLIFEIEDGAVLKINKIKYNALADVKNKAPVLLQNFSTVNVSENKNTTINLLQYFADPDGDKMSYSYYKADNITISFDNDIAAIVPDKGFEGVRYTFIAANDSDRTAVSNVFMINVSRETFKPMVEIGKPVRWVKNILIDVGNLSSVNFTLPETASNITISVLNQTAERELPDDKIKVIEDGKLKDKDTFEAGKELESVNRKIGILEEAKRKNSLKVSVDEKELGINELDSKLNELYAKKSELEQQLNNLSNAGGLITGNVVALTETTVNATQPLLVINESLAKNIEVQIEYETEAPIAIENEVNSFTKQIKVVSETPYTDVLSYTSLNDVPQQAIKLYWMQNGERVPFNDVQYFDDNNNSLIDRIEWVIPHLSNQTFEVSVTVLNVQSYPTVGGNWTVAFNTTGTGNLTISTFGGTTYAEKEIDDSSTVNDLDALELKCGADILEPLYIVDLGNLSLEGLTAISGNVIKRIDGNVISLEEKSGSHSQAIAPGQDLVPTRIQYTKANVFKYLSVDKSTLTELGSHSQAIAPDLGSGTLPGSAGSNFFPKGMEFPPPASKSNNENQNPIIEFFTLIPSAYALHVGSGAYSTINFNGQTYALLTKEQLTGHSYRIVGVYYENYNCDNQTGYWTVKVLTSGVHNQRFNFSNQIADAHNFATLASGNFTPDTTRKLTRTTTNDNGIIAYYSFDEGTGQTAADSAGGNNGVLGNNTNVASDDPVWTRDNHKGGYALKFDGVNDYVNLTSGVDISGGNYTLEAWVKFTQTNSQTFISMGNDADDNQYISLDTISGGTVRFTTKGGVASNTVTVFSQNSISDGLWHHVSGTKISDSSFQLYIDGTLANSSSTVSTTPSLNRFQLGTLGRTQFTNFFNGTMDEVRIYNRSLSSDEVYEHYKGRIGILLNWTLRTEPYERDNNTVLLLHLDGNFNDSSQYGNDGVKNGSVTFGPGRFGSLGAKFDGVNGYIDAGSSSTLKPANKLAVDFWMKYNDLRATNYVLGYGNTGFLGYTFTMSNNNIAFTIRNGAEDKGGVTQLSPGINDTNTWYHIAGVYDNPLVRLYVNGVMVSNASINGPISYTGLTSFRIGTLDDLTPGRYFNGTIDELRVSNTTREPDEFREYYTAGSYQENVQDAGAIVNWVNITWKENNLELGSDNSTVLLLHFDENTGQTAFDSSGMGNNGKLGNTTGVDNNDPVWTTGLHDYGLRFDGVDDMVNISRSPSMEPTDAITYEAWINPNKLFNYGAVLSKGDPNTNGYEFSTEADGEICIIIKTSGGFQSGDTTDRINEKTWSHVAVTYDSSTLNAYINGMKTSIKNGDCQLTTNAGSITHDKNDTFVGSRLGSTSFFNGTIDEVRILNRSLSASEVLADFKKGLTDIYLQTRTSNDNVTYTNWTGNADVPSFPETNKTLLYMPFDDYFTQNPKSLLDTRALTGFNGQKANLKKPYIDVNDVNLVGYWRFEEITDGQNVVDYSRYHNDGVLGSRVAGDSQEPALTQGIIGNAFDFNTHVAGGSFVNVSHSSSLALNPFAGTYSVELWLKADPHQSFYILEKNDNPGGYPMAWQTGANQGATFYISDGTNTAGVNFPNLLDSRWHNLIAIVDNTKDRLYAYKDGMLVDTTQNTLTSNPNDVGSLIIGNEAGGKTRPFNGTIDEVAIWNRSLTGQEIAAHALGGEYATRQVKVKQGKFQSGIYINSNSTFTIPIGASDDDDTLLLARFDDSNKGSTDEYSGEEGQAGNFTIDFCNIPNIVSAWKFEKSNADECGSNDGTTRGNVTNTSGYIGEAYSFDGKSSLFNTTNKRVISNNNITLEAWFKADSIKNYGDPQKIIVAHTASFRDIWLSLGDKYPEGVDFMVYDTTGTGHDLEANFSNQTNRWFHVTGTYDGSVQKIYLDGVLKNNATFTANFQFNDFVSIGNNFNGHQHFNGTIDEVAIYNRSLTPEEIQSHAGAVYARDKGRYGGGFYLSNETMLKFKTKDNIDVTGTIQFWLKPGWNGNDNIQHYLFDTAVSSTSNRISVYKTGNNNLILNLTGSSGSRAQTFAVDNTNLAANSWNHLAFTYSATNATGIFINGARQSSTYSEALTFAPISSFDNYMFIGTDFNQNFIANATFDDFKISSRELKDSEILNNYLGNFNASQGTIEFYTSDEWMGNDNSEHYFINLFDKNKTTSLFKLYKDANNVLAFNISDGTNTAQANYSISEWQANNFTHVAATWDANRIRLYTNGVLRSDESASSINFGNILNNLSSYMYVGSYNSSYGYLNGTIDELSIWNYPLTASEIKPQGYLKSEGETLVDANRQFIQWRALFSSRDPATTASVEAVTIITNSTNAPVIQNDYTIPLYPKKGDNVTFFANVSDADSNLVSVYFTIIDPTGTKVVNSANGSNNGIDGNWNVTFNVSSYGTWLWNVSAVDADGLTTNSTTSTIILMQLTGNLSKSSALTGDTVAVFGHVNLSNGTVLNNSAVSIFLDNVLMGMNNLTAGTAYLAALDKQFVDTADTDFNLGTLFNSRITGNGSDANLTINISYLQNQTLNMPQERFIVPNASTVLLLHFEEGTGQYANDSSFYGNNGTLGATNAAASDDPVWNSSTKFGSYGLSFNGNDFVNVTNSKGLNFSAGQGFALELWVKAPDKNPGVNGVLEATPYRIEGQGPKLLLVEIVDDSSNAALLWNVFNWTDNNWHHLAAVRDAASHELRFYADGTQINSTQDTTTGAFSLNSLLVGSSNGHAEFLTGTIDEVAIWNVSLNNATILNHYQLGLGYFNYSNFTSQVFDAGSVANFSYIQWNDFDNGKYGQDLSDSINASTVLYMKFDNATGESERAINETTNVSAETNLVLYMKFNNETGESERAINESYNVSAETNLVLYMKFNNETGESERAINESYNVSAETNLVLYMKFNNETGESERQLNETYNISNEQNLVLYMPFDNANAFELTPNASTVLLMHFNNRSDWGENNSFFVDNSTYQHNGTCNLATGQCPAVNTSGYKLGGAALTFDGVDNNNYVNISDSDDWAFGTKDFTIESWINTKDLRGDRGIVASIDGVNRWVFRLEATLALNFLVQGGMGLGTNYSLAQRFDINNWHHVAVTRTGNTFNFYEDGIIIGTATNTGSVPNLAGSLYIGQGAANSQNFNGSIDEVAIWNVSLSPQIIAQHSGYGIDKSIYGNNATIMNGTNVTFAGKFGQAMQFNGTNISNYISLPTKNLNITRGTVEAWFKLNGVATSPSNDPSIFTISRNADSTLTEFSLEFDQRSSVNTQGIHAAVRLNGVTQWQLRAPDSQFNSKTNRDWNHVAIVQDRTTPVMYINGVPVGNFGGTTDITKWFNDTFSASSPADSATIGSIRRGGSLDKPMYGIIDELAVWNKTFSADQIAQHAGAKRLDYSIYGNNGSYFSNTTSDFGANFTAGKFGKALTFDGANDAVNILNSTSLNITGTGLTLEAWINPISPSSDGNSRAFINKANHYSVAMQNQQITYADSVQFDYSLNGFYGYIGLNQWSHVAATFDGTNRRIYVNGVLVGTILKPGSLTAQPSSLLIGCYGVVSCDSPKTAFNGTIDEAAVWNTSLSADKIAEQAGAKVLDYSNYKNNGTHFTNDSENFGTNFTAGKFGKALVFDGVNDFVQIQNSQDFMENRGGNLTVEAWVNPSVLGTSGGIVSKNCAGGNSITFNLNKLNTDNMRFQFRRNSDNTNFAADSSAKLQANTWSHVAGTYNGSEVRVYVNGMLSGITAASGTTQANDCNVTIGGYNVFEAAPTYFTGTIDEPAVWNTTLSADKIAEQAGAKILDYSNYKNNGTHFTNDSENFGTNFTAGKFGKGLTFDGFNDFVNINHSSSLNFSGKNFSVELWAKDIGNGPMALVFKGDASGHDDFDISLKTNNLGQFLVYNNGGNPYESVITQQQMNDKQWHHWAMEYNNGTDTLSAYIDGVLIGKNNTAYVPFGPIGVGIGTGHVEIGAFLGTFVFNGTIDEVAIWSNSLSADKIAEQAGAKILDYSVYGNNGTRYSGTQSDFGANFTAGKFGKGLVFDGVNDDVNISNSTSLSITGNKITMEAWINPTVTPSNAYTIIQKNPIANDQRYMLYLNSGNKIIERIEVGSVVDCTSATPINLNQWNHAVGTYDGSNMKVYVNGVLSATCAQSGNIAGTDGSVHIGGGGNYFTGTIDEAAIWNISLDANTIKQQAQRGLTNLSIFYSGSNDTITWSNWQMAANSTLSTTNTLARYFKYLAIFNTSDARFTPILNNITVNYTGIFTDNLGNYNYSFTATGSATYVIKINMTWASTIIGEALASLTVGGNVAPNTPIINFPSNGSYINTNYALLNITISDSNSFLQTFTCYMYGDNATTNPTNLLNTSIPTTVNGSFVLFNWTNLNQTTYYWKAGCDDGALNGSNFTANFTVDTIFPQINYTATLSNGTFINQNFITVNITLTELNLANLTFYLWNGTDSLALYNESNFSTQTLFINFTSLDKNEKWYLINVTARDKANNVNSTETRNITLDSLNPRINFSDPTPANNSRAIGNSHVINLTLGDVSISSCILQVYNGTDNATNYTMQVRNLNCNVTISTRDGYNYTLKAYAVDSAGNANSTDNLSFRENTRPETPSLNAPANNTRQTSTSILLNYTTFDNDSDTLNYIVYFDTNSNPVTQVYRGASKTFVVTAARGSTYYWKVQADDSFENSSNSTTRQFLVNTLPPIPYIITPNLTGIQLRGGQAYNISWDNFTSDADGDNISIALYYSTDSGTTYPNTIASGLPNNGSYPWTAPSIDSNKVRVKAVANDSFEFISDESDNDFTIDSTAPVITLDNPPNGSSLNNGTFINLTITDNLANGINASWNNNSYPNSPNRTDFNGTYDINTTGWGIGNFDITVNANDSVGNSVTANFRFTVTNVQPVVTYNTPSPNQVISGTFRINVSATAQLDDAAFVNFTYEGATQNFTMTNAGTDYFYDFATTSVADGQRKLYVYANDTGGNVVRADILAIIDNTKPAITLNVPLNDTWKNASVTFVYTPNDLTSITSCSLVINSTINSTNASISKGIPNLFPNTAIGDGIYRWDTNCTDQAGNNGNNGTLMIIKIDTIKPVITLIDPPDGTSIKSNRTINFTVTDSGGSNVNNVTWSSSYILNSMDFIDTYAINTSSFPEGRMNITLFANDSAGNIENSLFTFVIDVTPPIAFFNKPGARQVVRGVFRVNITATDSLSNVSGVLFSFNESANFTMNRTSPEITSDYFFDWNTTNTSDNLYTLKVYGNDSANNIKSEPRFAIVDNTAPVIRLDNPANDTHSKTALNTFTFAPFELNRLNNCTLLINGSINATSTLLAKNSTNTFSVNLSDGNYRWTVNCSDEAVDTDGARNIGTNATELLISVDTIAPRINMSLNKTSPSQGDAINVTANVSDNIGLSFCQLITNYTVAKQFINKTVTGTSDQCSQNFTLGLAGVFNFTVVVNDTSNNLNQSQQIVAFSDIVPPQINMSLNGTLIELGDTINVTANVSDNIGLSFCQFVTNQTGANEYFNKSLTGAGDQCSQNFTIAAGGASAINFTVVVNDTANNKNQSEKVITVNDTIAPILESISLSSSSITDGSTLTLRIKCTDNSSNLNQINFTLQSPTGKLINRTSPTNFSVPSVRSYILNYTIFNGNETSEVGNWNVSAVGCSDIFNNSIYNTTTNGDLVFAVNSQPSPGGGGGGGGGGAGTGGGGGGSLTTAEEKAKDFSVSPSSIKEHLKLGTAKTDSITIKNTGETALSFGLNVATINDFVFLSSTGFSLEPGEEKTVEVNLIGKKLGSYIGEISISAGGISKSVNVVIEVESEQVLFDVKMDIPSAYKEVESGGNLKAQITLLNVGPARKVDVTTTYMIKDRQGNVVYETAETFAVEKQTSFVKSFKIPASLKPGEYLAVIEVRYENSFAVSSELFKVIPKEETVVQKVVKSRTAMMYVFAVVIGLVSLFAYLLVPKGKIFKKPGAEKTGKRDKR